MSRTFHLPTACWNRTQFAVGARPTSMNLSSRSRKMIMSPMTWPAGVTGTKCLARLKSKFAKLLMPTYSRNFRGVRAFDDQLVHVVRLVEQHGRVAPRHLLVAPVGEFRRHDRVTYMPIFELRRN